ncbi:DUF5710 domain-containing protein [Uliginosibacterium sp. H3]|uniref:DUF5710 domain-containing protein n=1 Tax=Uliginosibacterium silvisoli TaxID=3114758 RepID=A0ABU6K506_9RHOO|nr:DUF5710 domain-containing protein [Uliginosibacterium sp. H3]
MRFNLKVPFAEKDAAKALGARWDAASKLWYVEGKADMAPFAKWSPTPRDGAAPSSAAPSRAPVKAKAQSASAGIVQIGSRYVELPRVCECLPWDVCDKCRATALSA